MATVDFEDFCPEVAAECAGAPDSLIISAVRDASRDFCRRTLTWQNDPVSLPYADGTSDYFLDVPDEAQVVLVVSIVADSARRLVPATLDLLEARWPGWREASGAPRGFLVVDSKTVRFVPTPDADGDYVATAAFMPSSTATTLDAEVYDRYYDVIKSGALARLKTHTAEMFFDPSGAAFHRQLFIAGATAATADRNRGMARGVLYVRPVRFA